MIKYEMTVGDFGNAIVKAIHVKKSDLPLPVRISDLVIDKNKVTVILEPIPWGPNAVDWEHNINGLKKSKK